MEGSHAPLRAAAARVASAAVLPGENDRHQRGRILNRDDPMHDAGRQEEHLPRFERTALTIDGDVDPAFDALDRDLAGYAVRRQGFTRRQHQAHDFELLGFEQRGASFGREPGTKRPDVDQMT